METYQTLPNPSLLSNISTINTVESLPLDSDLPDSIKVDKHGKLLKKWFDYIGNLGSLKSSFDNWINDRIRLQLANQKIEVNTERGRAIITFRNSYVDSPKLEIESQVIPMMPRDAMENGRTYSGTLYTELVMTDTNDNVLEVMTGVPLGNIPIMVRSEKCNTTLLCENEKLFFGEDIYDEGGYFYIKGVARLIMLQEKLRVSRFFLFNSPAKGEPVCKITNEPINGSSVVSVIQDRSTKSLELRLGFMGAGDGKSPHGNTIPVFSAFRMLGGVTDFNVMFQFVALFVKPEWVKIVWVQLQSSFQRLNQIPDDFEYLGRKMAKESQKIDPVSRRNQIYTSMLDELFPQIPTTDSNAISKKLSMLSMMIARFGEYLAGLRKFDDRDNWGNKRLESAGRSMEQLFGVMIKRLVSKLQVDHEFKPNVNLTMIKKNIDRTIITDNFVSSFSSNKWGIKGPHAKKENVTDILKPENLIARYAQLTRINTPTSRRAKQAGIRLVQFSSLGEVDPVETPEGAQCLTLDTLVMLEDGTQVPIGDIGDRKVITVNPITLKKEISGIKDFFKYLSSDKQKTLFKVETITGRTLKATHDHPFLVLRGGEKEWIKTKDLLSNDRLCILLDGTLENEYAKNNKYETLEEFSEYNPIFEDYIFLEIDKVEALESEMVADFTTISDNHSFLANGFVTHNCGIVKNQSITSWLSLDRGDDIIMTNIREDIVEQKVLGQSTAVWLNGEQIGWANGATLYQKVILLLKDGLFANNTNIVFEDDDLLTINGNPNIINNISADIVEQKILSRITVVWLNGKYMGWCNGPLLQQKCIQLRRNGTFPFDTCIVLDSDNFLNINTDAARPMRPLLIVGETGRLVMDERPELWNESFEVLLREGAAEMLDPFEQEYVTIAYDFAKLEANSTAERRVEYTHCEVDPTAILGMSSSINPYPNFNQAPRNTYQASMAKQALGIYHSNHSGRFDTTAKLLAYPSRPGSETQMSEIIGFNNVPTGQTAVTAIMTQEQRTVEDAIQISKGAIDRGLFMMIIFKSFKSIAHNSGDIIETFSRPEESNNDRQYAHALGSNGIAITGSVVKADDILICKKRTIRSTGKVEYERIRVGVGQEGVVDKVLYTTNFEDKPVVYVKIRQCRKPVVGDKYASRYAQKATIGSIIAEADMPFIASGKYKGMRPDMLINPHSIPSRMTIGKLIEIVATEQGITDGRRVNATAFRPSQIPEIESKIGENGYTGVGTYNLRDGVSGAILKDPTGHKVAAEIFMGPCYYQSLKHQVLDKIQMRNRGAVKQTTRQPTAGRSNRGGQRYGEMERDGAISHGAAAFLRERLMLVSDAYKLVFCKICHTIAIGNMTTYSCRRCGTNAQFGVVMIPYAFKLLMHLLGGTCYNMLFEVSEVPTNNIGTTTNQTIVQALNNIPSLSIF
jgi:DNA-directed RNA polymerase beta subunit